jgi:hypothetical protein
MYLILTLEYAPIPIAYGLKMSLLLVKFQIGGEMVAAPESQAVWAPWRRQNLFIAYMLAVRSSNSSLVQSLIVFSVLMLEPIGTTNRHMDS